MSPNFLETPSGSYDRIVLAYNPRSRRASEIDRQMMVAAETGLAVHQIETLASPAAMRARLDEVLRPADLVAVWSGDGGGSTVAQAMMGRRQPVVLLPGGNACDSYVMVNKGKALPEILLTGRAIDLRPLEIAAKDPEGRPTLRRAIGYFSIGAAATASRRIDLRRDQPPGGLPTFLGEVAVCVDSLAREPHFTMVTEPIGKVEASDRTFARGNVMAKDGRTHANLAEPLFEDVSTRVNGYLGAMLSLMKLGAGMLKGAMSEEVQFTAVSQNGERLPVQYDGEYDTIASGSQVMVSVSSESYRTLTTRLR